MKLNTKLAGLLGAGLCSLTLTTAISQAEETPVTAVPPVPPTFADVATIIADNCQLCHSGGADAVAGVSLDTEAEVVAVAAQAFAALDTGLMPYGDSEWRSTPDGMKLLAYLKSQIPAEMLTVPTTASAPR